MVLTLYFSSFYTLALVLTETGSSCVRLLFSEGWEVSLWESSDAGKKDRLCMLEVLVCDGNACSSKLVLLSPENKIAHVQMTVN